MVISASICSVFYSICRRKLIPLDECRKKMQSLPVCQLKKERQVNFEESWAKVGYHSRQVDYDEQILRVLVENGRPRRRRASGTNAKREREREQLRDDEADRPWLIGCLQPKSLAGGSWWWMVLMAAAGMSRYKQVSKTHWLESKNTTHMWISLALLMIFLVGVLLLFAMRITNQEYHQECDWDPHMMIFLVGVLLLFAMRIITRRDGINH